MSASPKRTSYQPWPPHPHHPLLLLLAFQRQDGPTEFFSRNFLHLSPCFGERSQWGKQSLFATKSCNSRSLLPLSIPRVQVKLTSSKSVSLNISTPRELERPGRKEPDAQTKRVTVTEGGRSSLFLCGISFEGSRVYTYVLVLRVARERLRTSSQHDRFLSLTAYHSPPAPQLIF